MSLERYIPPPVDLALERREFERQDVFTHRGPVIEVYFPAAASPVDVRHYLDAIPAGFVCILPVAGVISAVRVIEWTSEIAWLQADADHSRARVFFVTTEEPIRNGHI